jgi:hypothetical protein
MKMLSGEYFFVDFPDGTIGGFPAWMADSSACSAYTLSTPQSSAYALAELQDLLNGVITCSLESNALAVETPQEKPHAPREDIESATNESAVRRPSSSPTSRRKAARFDRRTRRPSAQRGSSRM